MQDTILTIYCLCDDLLKAMDHHDDPQTKLSSAQVRAVPLVAACFFGGKIEWARRFLLEHGYCTKPRSQSRLNRRLHACMLACFALRVVANTVRAVGRSLQNP